MAWREAIGTLERERTLGESGARLLKQYLGGDAAALAQGEARYATARAAFDALIGQLLVDLAEKRSPEESGDLEAAIEAAVAEREAFSRHVAAQLPDTTGQRGVFETLVVGELIQPAVDLVVGLIGAGVEIWKEWHRRDEIRREALKSQVEATRWRRFEDI